MERWRRATPTYDHVASTLRDSFRPGRQEHSVVVGRSRTDFDAAVCALESFAPQRAVGARVNPIGARPEPDATVVLSVGIGPLSLLVPTRITVVVDEPTRRGYAYGTLPGHPEAGEELFLLEMADDGVVTFTIRIDAEPIRQLRWLARIIGPVQRLATSRYLAAVAKAVRTDRGHDPGPDRGQ